MLHENKRLKTQADKDILKQFKAYIFNEAIPTAVTIKKYFKFASAVKTQNNTAYTNSTSESVAETVRKRLRKTDDYEVGEALAGRKYLKGKFGKRSANFDTIMKKAKTRQSSLGRFM